MGKLTDIEDVSDIVEDDKECVKNAKTHFSRWMLEAKENYDMAAGDQWSLEDKNKLEDNGRVPVVFDRMGTILDSVCGFEVNNRQEQKFIPRNPEDSGYAEILTQVNDWIRDNCDAEDEESDSFRDMLICGTGWTETHLDYEEDSEGKLIIERIDPLSMSYDPAARKRNIVDATWVRREKWLSKEEISQKWPDKADEIVLISSEVDDDKVSPHHVNPLTWYKNGEARIGESRHNKIPVGQRQWYEMEDEYHFQDPMTGQVTKLAPKDFKKAKKRFRELMGVDIQGAKVPKRVYYQSFVCGNVELEYGKSPCQTGFNFQCITGKRDRNQGIFFGLVRPMKDPQRWANKFFSQVLHIINTNAKGGILAESDAFDNRRKAESDWAKSDSIIWMNPGGLEKVRDKPIPNIPTELQAMMQFSISSIRDASGVNLEILGMADRQQAGVLEAQRTKAGLTILAPYFDSLRLYRKRQARIAVFYIENFLPMQKIARIVGKDNAQFVPMIQTPGAFQYDISVDTSPTSRDVKDRTWAALQQILPVAMKEGLPMPPDILKYAPIPEALADKWQQAITQQQQQPKGPPPEVQKQMQAAQQQIQQGMQQVQQKTQQLQQQEQALNQQKGQQEMEQMSLDLQKREMDLQKQAMATINQAQQTKFSTEQQSKVDQAIMQVKEMIQQHEQFINNVVNANKQAKLQSQADNVSRETPQEDSQEMQVIAQSHTQLMGAIAQLVQTMAAPKTKKAILDGNGNVVGMTETVQ